jgi:hypothetical protein
MTAAELKIGDTFKRQGYSFKVVKITQDSYKNGTPSVIVECTTNGGDIVDSFFNFKLTTKIKWTKAEKEKGQVANLLLTKPKQ